MRRAQAAAGSLLVDGLPDGLDEGVPLADADPDGGDAVEDDPQPAAASPVAHTAARTAVARRRTIAWSHDSRPRTAQPLTPCDAKRKAAATAGGSRTAM